MLVYKIFKKSTIKFNDNYYHLVVISITLFLVVIFIIVMIKMVRLYYDVCINFLIDQAPQYIFRTISFFISLLFVIKPPIDYSFIFIRN